jgi:hypothetical protein
MHEEKEIKKKFFEQQMPKQEKIDRKKREIQRDFGRFGF